MSAGRDVRGIKRGHQFDKVEMYKFCLPEKSDEELEAMRADAEAVCAGLGLTYRIRVLCGGDLALARASPTTLRCGRPAAEWLEVSSVSNCGDFQARRANVRFRRAKAPGPSSFIHSMDQGWRCHALSSPSWKTINRGWQHRRARSAAALPGWRRGYPIVSPYHFISVCKIRRCANQGFA